MFSSDFGPELYILLFNYYQSIYNQYFILTLNTISTCSLFWELFSRLPSTYGTVVTQNS